MRIILCGCAKKMSAFRPFGIGLNFLIVGSSTQRGYGKGLVGRKKANQLQVQVRREDRVSEHYRNLRNLRADKKNKKEAKQQQAQHKSSYLM